MKRRELLKALGLGMVGAGVAKATPKMDVIQKEHKEEQKTKKILKQYHSTGVGISG